MTTTDMPTRPHSVSSAGAVPRTRPAPAPLATAGASRVAVLVALAFMAVGAVGVRDALLGAGWTHGTQWLPATLRAVDALTPGLWLLPVGTLAAVVGLGLMVTALAPRHRTASALKADSAVYLRLRDIGTIAGAAASSVGGVLHARVKASRRRAVVRCRITGETTPDLETSIAAAVSDALSGLETPPRVVVRLRTETRS